MLLVPSCSELLLPESTVSTRARDNGMGVALASPGNAGIYDATGSEVVTQSIHVEGGELCVGLLKD